MACLTHWWTSQSSPSGSATRRVPTSSDAAMGLDWVQPDFDDSSIAYPDCGAWERLSASGALLLGKTATHECADLAGLASLAIG